MVATVLAFLERAFDALEELWERKETQRVVGGALIAVFLFLLAMIELSRRQLLTDLAFRNSGFAVATVVIRLALTAPPFINVDLGLDAAFFAIGVTWIYNQSEKIASVSFLSSSDAK